jgi:hypothetical protein
MWVSRDKHAAQEREWTLMTGYEADEAATYFHRCDGERT